ncbi:MAG: glucose 1-dehydrogenase [Deltaproteobacteria bacterium]|nr:glucose 1-dehydrogenase [Deltaproteobacteria bacterium]
MHAPLSTSHQRLDGKVAIVTGASRGIGAAIARTLGAAGAKVVLAARKPEGLVEVADAIVSAGGAALAKPCHAGKPEDIEALFELAISTYGHVDILVNNAATNPYFGQLIDVDWGAWDKTFEVNVKGYFAATRLLVRHLEARAAGGSVINVASIMGMHGAPMQGVYGMTKAAVISMTKTLAVELGSRGIRVNAIAPGLVETRFARALLEADMIRDPLVARTPLGRVGQPEDISQAVLYFASDASAWVTGQVLVLDGGLTVGA